MNKTGLAIVAAFLFGAVSAVFGADAPQAGFSLTIYSTADPATFDPQDYARQAAQNAYYFLQNPLPGFGVVRENRNIHLEAGDNTLRFTDVAQQIDPTTVSFQALTSPGSASVLEQNYEYDLVSADKILGKYLGQGVALTRRGANGAEVLQGDLLSFDDSNLVIQQASGDVQVIPRGNDLMGIQLAKSDTGLITKPTLVWKIHSDKGQDQLAQVTYQTSSLTWRADYNLTLDAAEDAADLGAWVTIMNESGASYPDARLKLVAGDVQRIQPPRPVYQMARSVAGLAGEAEQGFVEKPFFEYHLYTLGRTTSVSNNSTKQIELFEPKLGVPVTKTYVYFGAGEELRNWNYGGAPNLDSGLGTQANKKVDVYLVLNNSEKNGLGIPLPAGRIRAYKRDEADGSSEFIGEDVVQHTPKDEEVRMKLGSAFDIVGDRRQTDFSVNTNGHESTESFEIKVRNHKSDAVHVIVRENLYRWANWEITAASDSWEKKDFRTIEFPVDVGKDGEKTVTYTVRYTW
jgi:hypothetical protein